MTGNINKLLSLAKSFEAANIGYDQKQRWTWLDKKNRKIIPNREADCSSGSLGLVWLAGYSINISDTCYSGNAASLLKKAGFKIVRYTSKSQCKPGRVFIAVGHHVAFATGSNQLYNISIDERGKISGGKAGDQSRKETRYRTFYNYPWTYVAIPPDEGSTPAKPVLGKPVTKPKPATLTPPKFPLPKGYYYGPVTGPDQSVSGKVKRRDGLTGADLKIWQQRMKTRGWHLSATGKYDTTTAKIARQFQQEKRLDVDALIGPETWAAAWTTPIT